MEIEEQKKFKNQIPISILKFGFGFVFIIIIYFIFYIKTKQLLITDYHLDELTSDEY